MSQRKPSLVIRNAASRSPKSIRLMVQYKLQNGARFSSDKWNDWREFDDGDLSEAKTYIAYRLSIHKRFRFRVVRRTTRDVVVSLINADDGDKTSFRPIDAPLDSMVRWVVLFRSRNKRDGYHQHIQRENGKWAIFRTRRAARDYAFEKLGYIVRRDDLRREPHGWLSPKVVRVTITASLPRGIHE